MKLTVIILFVLSSFLAFAQTGSSADSVPVTITHVKETFRSSRVIIGHSVETPPNGALVFLVSHHFGAINSGFYNFYGLDQASTRIGLEYGINNYLGIGVGRSTYEKTFDGYIKGRILRQTTDNKIMPLSLTLFGNMTINTLKLSDPDQKDYFDARLSYCTELIIARKFGKLFSLELAPTWIHKNLVDTPDDHNNLFSIGSGVSFRVSKMISINGEYHYLLPNQHLNDISNSFSVDCDIKVGEHVFQLFLTNSQGNFEEAFITETEGKWIDGDIYFGFNIHRYFKVKYPKKLDL